METTVRLYFIVVVLFLTDFKCLNLAECTYIGDLGLKRVNIDSKDMEDTKDHINLKESRKRSQNIMVSNIKSIDGGEEAEEARGHKHKHKHHHKHMNKYIHKVMAVMLVLKAILFPILIKFSTAVSAASFVMSKIALIVSGLLAVKWLISSEKKEPKSRVEIVQVPTKGWETSWKRYPYPSPSYKDVEYDTFWEDTVDSYAAPTYKKRGRRKEEERDEKQFL